MGHLIEIQTLLEESFEKTGTKYSNLEWIVLINLVGLIVYGASDKYRRAHVDVVDARLKPKVFG
jgi:hypothetical protein